MKSPKDKMIRVSPIEKGETQIIKKNEEVAIMPNQGKSEIDNLIGRAIDQNVPVESLERLLAMRRELKAEKAKELFDAAMATFQGECPVIKKKKAGGSVKNGPVAYYYAPLEDIVVQVRPFISKNGFSYSIKTEVTQNDKNETKVESTCIVKHIAGHSESSAFKVPLGAQTGIMSAPQVVSAAATFSKRVAFCNAFGIMTGDNDTDAASTGISAFEKAMEIISQSKNEKGLTEYKDKIAGSDKYTADQKRDILAAVDSRIGEIKFVKKIDAGKI